MNIFKTIGCFTVKPTIYNFYIIESFSLHYPDKKIEWILERNYYPCSMNKTTLQVEVHRPCGLIGPHIPFQQKMRKNMRVIPIMKRTSTPSDELSICLWFYNDDLLEHDVNIFILIPHVVLGY